MIPGQPVTLSVTTTGPGFLDAWMDWNIDGDFNEADEQIFGALALPSGTTTLTINVPASALPGASFSRYRYSSTGGLSWDGVLPSGQIPDGEVEDYQIAVEEETAWKWFQAPDLERTGIDVNASPGQKDYILADDFLCNERTYITEIHVFGSWLGDNLPNFEPHNVHFQLSFHSDQPGIPGEEYSRPLETLWFMDFEPGTFQVRPYMENIEEGWLDPPDSYQPPPADTICYEYVFQIPVDDAFIQDGSIEFPRVYWLDVKALPHGDGTEMFGWKTSVNHWNDDAVWGEGIEPYPGPWWELRYPDEHLMAGESIDLAFGLVGEPAPDAYDWGDAPDTYHTLAASNGPHHVLTNLYLGSLIDSEPNGQPSAAALGDDMNNLADEDGVVFVGPFIRGQGGLMHITSSTNGLLDVWMDWNSDGDFGEANEHIFISIPISSGVTGWVASIPPDAVLGATIGRFRLSSAGGLRYDGVLPSGQIPDGEVEDHQIVIEEEVSWKWFQAPDLERTGIDVNASPGQRDYILADDFLCNERSYITEVHVFGSWLGDNPPRLEPHNVHFQLSFHSDQPAIGEEHSRPLETLWFMDFEPGTFQVRPYMEGIAEGWMDPPDMYQPPPADTICYEYIFLIDQAEAFIQEGSEQARRIYWLDVKAFPVGGDGTEMFGWKTSLNHWNDDAVWGSGIEPYPGPWFELRYPPGHPMEPESIDLAFGLVGEPAPDPDPYDWGDAPDSYRTLFAAMGPRHLAGPLFLGNLIDTERDGQPTAAADGDDTNNLPDEDGVVFMTGLKPGQPAQIDVTASQNGMLDAWIDWDGNGNFSGVNEQIFASEPLIPGLNSLNITVPAAILENVTSYARFRLSSGGGLAYGGDYPDGTIPDGEVEDYTVFLEDKYVYKWIQHPDLSPEGIDVNATALGGEDHILADDFLCNTTGPLTDIHVWGSWFNDRYPNQGAGEVTFTLSIHADIPADQSPTEYSMPGELLWIRNFAPGEFETIEFADHIEEGWLDPPAVYIFPADWTCWQYKFHIDPHLAFKQEGTQDQPVVYWLDLQAHVEEQGPMFGWKTTMDHWNDDAVWGYGLESFAGPWNELIYPVGHQLVGQSIDLAFAVYQDLVTPVPEVPEKVGLLYNAPNPFNPMTVIHFVMPDGGGTARLEIFDARGRLVATLVDGMLGGGRQRETWFGVDDSGQAQPSGVYFYRLTRPEGAETLKMLLLK